MGSYLLGLHAFNRFHQYLFFVIFSRMLSSMYLNTETKQCRYHHLSSSSDKSPAAHVVYVWNTSKVLKECEGLNYFMWILRGVLPYRRILAFLVNARWGQCYKIFYLFFFLPQGLIIECIHTMARRGHLLDDRDKEETLILFLVSPKSPCQPLFPT